MNKFVKKLYLKISNKGLIEKTLILRRSKESYILWQKEKARFYSLIR